VIDIAAGVWRETLDTIRVCGRGKRECVVFWLGPASNPALVNQVVHPLHIASRGYFELDANWLMRFWVGLAQAQLSVRVQVHTHEESAFHSDLDDEGAVVQVPGFLSLVLPFFAVRDEILRDAYLAQLSNDGRFVHLPIASTLRFLG
jgi:hypothetical protein